MAKMYFFYSVMNAGKTTLLLQTAHNYRENGGRVLIITSAIDDRSGVGVVSSRIGLSAEAVALSTDDNLFDFVDREHEIEPITAVLMDEVQFMSRDQIWQASDVVDELNVPVLAYGLKNNYQGDVFSPAVSALLALSDKISECKQLCHCGAKATMILKYDASGHPIKSGDVVEIGGEEKYVSVCRKHWKEGNIGAAARSRISPKAA